MSLQIVTMKKQKRALWAIRTQTWDILVVCLYGSRLALLGTKLIRDCDQRSMCPATNYADDKTMVYHLV